MLARIDGHDEEVTKSFERLSQLEAEEEERAQRREFGQRGGWLPRAATLIRLLYDHRWKEAHAECISMLKKHKDIWRDKQIKGNCGFVLA